MFIRAWSAVALLIFSAVTVVAAECDCETEVHNASAKTSDSCGNIWKEVASHLNRFIHARTCSRSVHRN
ncbi:hypothetical protein CQZ93_25540 [Ochrobactrum vermis]|nr:hypothetical protein CQZ93_25540 [Ochrobactrum vermis]